MLKPRTGALTVSNLDHTAGRYVNHGARVAVLVWRLLAPSRGPANASSAHFASEAHPAIRFAGLWIVPGRMKIQRLWECARGVKFGPSGPQLRCLA